MLGACTTCWGTCGSGLMMTGTDLTRGHLRTAVRGRSPRGVLPAWSGAPPGTSTPGTCAPRAATGTRQTSAANTWAFAASELRNEPAKPRSGQERIDEIERGAPSQLAWRALALGSEEVEEDDAARERRLARGRCIRSACTRVAAITPRGPSQTCPPADAARRTAAVGGARDRPRRQRVRSRPPKAIAGPSCSQAHPREAPGHTISHRRC
jgi:hypothetical protein